MKIILPLVFPLIVLANPAFGQSPKLGPERAILHTNLGDLVLGFYPEVAPRHVAQVLRLIELGIYDGAEIFRIEPGFVAQIENFNMRKIPLPLEKQQTISKIRAEFSSLPHVRGTLSMARFDDPDSAESSFSLVLGTAPHLDRNYTVFGTVLEGMDVLTAIEQVPVEKTRPTVEVKIIRAEAIRPGTSYSMPSGGFALGFYGTGTIILLIALAGILFFTSSGKNTA